MVRCQRGKCATICTCTHTHTHTHTYTHTHSLSPYRSPSSGFRAQCAPEEECGPPPLSREVSPVLGSTSEAPHLPGSAPPGSRCSIVRPTHHHRPTHYLRPTCYRSHEFPANFFHASLCRQSPWHSTCPQPWDWPLQLYLEHTSAALARQTCLGRHVRMPAPNPTIKLHLEPLVRGAHLGLQGVNVPAQIRRWQLRSI
jgi:hypothetical protein